MALIADEVDRRRTPVLASALVGADSVWLCLSTFGNRVRIGGTGADGRVEVELRGHSARSLAAEAAALGALLEVLDPPEVRAELAALGAQLAAVYARGPDLLVAEAVLVAAPAEQVWSTIVEREERARWWPYLDLDATTGGRFEERWTDATGTEVVTSGEVLEIERSRLLRLSWKDDGWPVATEVELRLDPLRDATLVGVRHTGWSSLPDASALVPDHRAGWRMHLEDLARVHSAS